MPLSLDDDGGYSDPTTLAAIARRLTLAGAPMVPTAAPGAPSAGLTYTPPPPPQSDPFRFLAPVGNTIGAVGNAIGGAFHAAQDAPGIGGVLRGLSAAGDAAIGTPIGLAALGADQFLHTGLTDAANRANAGRPFWELPKTAANTISQGLAGVANDPNADPFARLVAGTAGAVKDVGSLVAPIPGLGEAAALARRVGRFAPAAEDAAAAAARESNVVRPVFGDVAEAARNSTAVRASDRFQFTPPDAAPVADVHAPDVAPPIETIPTAITSATAPGRYSVIQHAPDTFQVISPSGREGPVFSTANGFRSDPQAAAQAAAERMNAAHAPAASAPAADATRQAAIAKASKDFLAASGLTENPKPTPGFGAPGTAFHGQDIGQIVRTIKATTPYKSFQEFGAAVRSGAAEKSGAPRDLIDLFKRGEAERNAPTPTRSPGFDTVPGSAPARADGTGTETIAQAKQRLADRLGVDPNTGRPLQGAAPGTGPLSPEGVRIPDAPSSTPSSGWDKFLSAWNLPKALKASLDLSAPLRQGILLAPGHPRDFFGAFKPMLQAAKDPRFAAALDAQIKSVDRPGLYLAPIDGSLGAREEAFMSNLANKIPGVSGSNRAYTTFLNKLRADVYDHTLQGWTAGGKAVSEADRAGLANVINHFTGRGDLPNAVKDLTPALNGLFFSPRFTVSRFQSVGDALGVLKNRDSLAAQQAASDMVKFVSAGLGVLALAKLAGANVESDPRSSAFGKMQFGDTSVELWGGLQPMARYAAQLITGQSKPIAGAHAGEVINAARSDTLTRFGESKLAPSANVALGVLKGPTKNAPAGSIGRNFIGQNFSATDLIDPTPGANNSLVTPLGWSDIADAIAADRAKGGSGLGGALTGATSLLGAGVQSISRSGAQSGPPSAPRPNFRFTTTSRTTGAAGGGGAFRFQVPSSPRGSSSIGAGSHLPAPILDGGGSPGTDIPSVIQNTARTSGIDPLLALAVAQQESGFNPNAVGDNGNSHGLFQENINGRGYGRAPDYDPARQTARFAADVRAALAAGFRGTPGQLAAAVQRPADPVGYARSVDAIYASLGGR